METKAASRKARRFLRREIKTLPGTRRRLQHSMAIRPRKRRTEP